MNVILALAAGLGLAPFDFAFVGAMAGMSIGCRYELKLRRFPNWLSLPMLLVVAVWRVLTGDPIHWLVLFVAVWGYFYWAWTRGFMGGGDAKGLMVLSGLWPTWQAMLAFLVWLAATLFLYGLGAVLFHNRGNLGKTWRRLLTLHAHFVSNEPALPKKEMLLVPAVISTMLFYLVLGRAWSV